MIIRNGAVNRGSIFLRVISVIQVSNIKQINFIEIDKEDVRNFSDKELKSLGLNKRGHLICLKCFSIDCTKMKFPIKDFFSKCEEINIFLRIWSHLLKKSLMENFIFCAVLEPEKSKSYDSPLPIKIRKKELAISVKKVEQILFYSIYLFIYSFISFFLQNKVHKKTKTNTEYLIKIHMVLISSEMRLNL